MAYLLHNESTSYGRLRVEKHTLLDDPKEDLEATKIKRL